MIIRKILVAGTILLACTLGVMWSFAKTEKDTSPPSPMSVKEIEELLSTKRLLMRGAIDEEHPNHQLFLQQRKAIQQAGTLKLAHMVPQLVMCLDYPGNLLARYGISTMTLDERRRRDQQLVGEEWPAFGAILNIGMEAAPYLEKFIKDYTQDMQYRMTALEVLKVIDAERVKPLGELLLMTIDKRAYPDGAEVIQAILKGKYHFWGLRRLNAKIDRK